MKIYQFKPAGEDVWILRSKEQFDFSPHTRLAGMWRQLERARLDRRTDRSSS